MQAVLASDGPVTSTSEVNTQIPQLVLLVAGQRMVSSLRISVAPLLLNPCQQLNTSPGKTLHA